MRVVYVMLGRKCGHSHAYEVDFDMLQMLKSGGNFPVKLREVELRHGATDLQIKAIIFDEYVETPKKKAKK
jgi:hypothetical protein